MKPARKDWIALNNEKWGGAIQILFADGTSFDWSQYSVIKLQIKAYALQPEADVSLSLGAGLSVDSIDRSWLDIAVELDDVKDLLGVYAYDIVGVNDGDPTVVVYGSITVNQGVTL